MTLSFAKLPANLSELSALAESSLEKPEYTAALFILSLAVWPDDRDEAVKMINFLKGPQPLSNMDISFLRDRFMDKMYLPRSYFAGAVPVNNYQPTVPYSIEITENPYSYSQAGCAKLFVTCGGADSPRQITLRQKGDKWYLWEYAGILLSIRLPAAEDAWV